MLGDECRDRADAKRSKRDQVSNRPSASPAAPELTAIQTAITNLVAQEAQQNALIHELRDQRGGASTTADLPEFEVFQKRNLATICSTVVPDSQRMYRGTAKRLIGALVVYRRYERMKEFSKSGQSSEPDLWNILTDLEPGGIWGYWRNRRKLDNSSLNQLWCYLRAFVSACRSVNPICTDLIELTCYTGQRPCNMKDIR